MRRGKIGMDTPSLPVRSKALPTAPALLHVGAVFCLAWLFISPATAADPDVEGIVRRIFPQGTSIQEKTLWLSESDKAFVRRVSRLPFDADHLPYVVVSDTARAVGYAFVDDVKGLHEMITYLAALNADGTVRAVEVLVYRESYGGEIRNDRFRGQFTGKSIQDPIRVGSDIRNVAGATISTNAISAGVRKILALYEAGIKGGGRERESPGGGGRHHRSRVLWGTTLTIETIDAPAENADRAIEAAFDDVERLTAIFSRYDTSSEISRINSSAGGSTGAHSAEFNELLNLAADMKKKSHGLFDPEWRGKHPVELDLDGIAKGYAVDRIVQLFKRKNIRRALINFGESSIAALGAPDGQTGWEIPVRDARNPAAVTETPLATLVLRDAVLSVSGAYARGPHIIDPFTGKPPPDSLQAVVVGPLLPDASAHADALSTALFAGGKSELPDVEHCGFEGMWLGRGQAVRTKRFSEYEKAP